MDGILPKHADRSLKKPHLPSSRPLDIFRQKFSAPPAQPWTRSTPKPRPIPGIPAVPNRALPPENAPETDGHLRIHIQDKSFHPVDHPDNQTFDNSQAIRFNVNRSGELSRASTMRSAVLAIPINRSSTGWSSLCISRPGTCSRSLLAASRTLERTTAEKPISV